MKHERLESPQQFAAHVSRHLAGLADMPSEADLTALVDAMFFASLHEEEARYVEFAVAWQPGVHDCAAVVAITPAVPLTPKNLVKLAPATWQASSIAIHREGDTLVAWALLERRSRQPLTIRVLAPGVLRVEYDGTPRALYARGECLLVGDVRSPVERLAQVFGGWPHAKIVAKLANRALAHGHGGMILVVPAHVETPVGVRVHYGIGSGADLLVDERRPESIDLVARLTAIDNALLLDTDLRVRGFGVQVIEGEAPTIQFAHVDPYNGDSHIDDLTTFKGTRHPAGVIFCMRQPGEAAAIIASQDSRLSIASKDARGVVEVLGSYERGFGWL